MEINLDYAPGATPLDPDELSALIPKHISTQAELNEWEQLNILQGEAWAKKQKRKELLDENFVRQLHKHMFDETWAWAGVLRTSDKNIGIDWRQIGVCLRDLLADARYQIDNQIFMVDEIAVRFHHRLVSIHLFPNGNGRHARLMADLLAIKLGQARFTWGSKRLIEANTTREQYLQALQSADQHDYQPLCAFARS